MVKAIDNGANTESLALARATSREVETLQREVAQLKRDQAPLRAQPASAGSAREPGAQPSFDADEATIAAARAEAQAKMRNFRDHLEASFQGEHRESAWAKQTEGTIQNTVAAVEGLTLMEASCATKLCKVVAKSDDTTAQLHIPQDLAEKEPFKNGTFYSYDGLVTTMYLSREGHRLPGPPR
ncbi:MAG: hypothetical protein ABW133_16920 [Polyangiaceae bacterium]